MKNLFRIILINKNRTMTRFTRQISLIIRRHRNTLPHKGKTVVREIRGHHTLPAILLSRGAHLHVDENMLMGQSD